MFLKIKRFYSDVKSWWNGGFSASLRDEPAATILCLILSVTKWLLAVLSIGFTLKGVRALRRKKK